MGLRRKLLCAPPSLLPGPNSWPFSAQQGGFLHRPLAPYGLSLRHAWQIAKRGFFFSPRLFPQHHSSYEVKRNEQRAQAQPGRRLGAGLLSHLASASRSLTDSRRAHHRAFAGPNREWLCDQPIAPWQSPHCRAEGSHPSPLPVAHADYELSDSLAPRMIRCAKCCHLDRTTARHPSATLDLF